MIVYAILTLCGAYVSTVAFTKDIPKSHVPILERIIAKYVNATPTKQSSFVDVIFGGGGAENWDSLDVHQLNHRTLKNILEAETLRLKNESAENYRRQVQSLFPTTVLLNPKNQPIIDKFFDFMKQSIYGVRYRMEETRLLRLKFRQSDAYNIGIIVSNVFKLIQKCEHQLSHAMTLPRKSFMLWHLIIYEKILASSVDVENLVERAFLYQKSYSDRLAEFMDSEAMLEEPGGKGGTQFTVGPGKPTGGYGSKPEMHGSSPYHPGGKK